MCVDPATAMVIGGTALAVVGKMQEASAHARADTANASQSMAAAQVTSNKTAMDVDQADRRFEKQQGTVRNIIGGSGIAPSSFQAVIDDDSSESFLEKATIRANGDAQRSQLNFQAQNYLDSADTARSAGVIGALTSVASGGKSLAMLSNPSRYPAANAGYGGVEFDTNG